MRGVLASARGHVIVLGVDGIPYELACRVWPRAQIARARSVFPTTSATAWTTSLTGASVDEHGIPGVVFTVGDQLVNVYSYRGPLGDAPPEDLFSDATRAGYTPVAILGDLENTHCTWRDQLVQRASLVRGHPFFDRGDPAGLAAAVEAALAAHEGRCLVWCFVDADRHIHHHGYDEAMLDFLAGIDALASEWAARGAVVVAHSDHGLVSTRHDPRVADAIARVGCPVGGAGRTRWLYADDEGRARDLLARHLPASVSVHHADEFFAPGSLARRRVGPIVLIARGEDFLADDGYQFEHGSLTATELDVPVAEWRA